MKILACQFSKISGPDATANYKIEFTVDESQRNGVQKLLSFKKGTSLLMFIYDVEHEEKEIKDLTIETPEQTKIRFNKRLNVLIKQIARDKDIDSEKVKTTLKDFLKRKKMLKESLKELDVKQLAAAIYYLQTEYGQDNFKNE